MSSLSGQEIIVKVPKSNGSILAAAILGIILGAMIGYFFGYRSGWNAAINCVAAYITQGTVGPCI